MRNEIRAMSKSYPLWSMRVAVAATVVGFFVYRCCKRLERSIPMKAQDYSLAKTTSWQRIFLQSKANGAAYNGEQLVGFNWDWPKNTFLQRRLEYLRKYRSSDELAYLDQSSDPATIQQELRN